MALATANILRQRLADPLRRTAQYLLGDGTATAFSLSGYPIVSGAGSASVRIVAAGGVLTATGGTAWDYDNGILAFATALSAGSAALIDYHWSVLSQEAIDTITALQSELDGMTLEGLRWIAADYAKRQKWAMAQGPSVDPQGAQRALMDLLKYYEDRTESGATADGGLESWAEWQQAAGS